MLNRDQEAEMLYRQVLNARKPEKRSDYFNTATGLANSLGNLGEFVEAEHLYREVLAHKKATLGLENTRTLWIMGQLAWILIEEEEFGETEDLCRQVFTAREVTLEIGH